MSEIKSKFTLHTEYKDFVPGKNQPEFPMEVLAPRLRGAMLVILVVFNAISVISILGSVFMMVAFAYIGSVYHQFLQEGQQVVATIISCKEYSDSKKVNSVYIYSYSVSGVSYEGRDSLLEYCGDHPVDSTLKAIYLPSNPSQSHINMAILLSSERATMPLIIMLGGYTLVFLLVLWWFGLRLKRYLYARRHRRELATNSQPLPGEITAINGYRPESYGPYYVRVWYQFQAPNKTLLKGLGEAYREDLRGNLPAVGTPVTVLYATDGSHMIL